MGFDACHMLARKRIDTSKSSSQRMKMDEVGLTVEDGKVVREEFFFFSGGL
jgi:hypothetical protein